MAAVDSAGKRGTGAGFSLIESQISQLFNMARKPKIDIVKLDNLLNKFNKSETECAEYFGVSPSAISKAKSKLNNFITKTTVLEAAPIVYQRNLNTVDQLNKINRDANEILDLVMGWARGDENCIRILETQVKKVKWREKDGEDRELDVQEIKFKDPREIALKAMAEIRNQLKLQLEIYQTLYDVKAAEEFQQEVLTAIGEAAPDVRARIIINLQEKRAIRSAIQFAQ